VEAVGDFNSAYRKAMMQKSEGGKIDATSALALPTDHLRRTVYRIAAILVLHSRETGL